MKRFALALLGVALSMPALSQSSDSKIKAYLRGGVNYNLSGVGLDLGSLTVDVALNSAFTAQGGTWNGLPLSNRPSEYLVSLGYKL